MLHPHVLFVGDRPNPRRNIDMYTPFVGTPSYRVLLDWIYRMDLDIGLVMMVNAFKVDGSLNPALDTCIYRDTRVVALGKNAATRLLERSRGSIAPLPYFVLPHPSGRNLELNDKKKLGEYLTRCKDFIYKGPK